VTKKEILKVSLKHFALKGYENTSLEDIAKELNITKPAIYYHFKNKNSLYNQIFIDYFKDLKLKEDLKEYIYTMGNFFIQNPYIAKLFSKELSCEMEHLETDTIKIVSKTLQTLIKILKDTKINPFFLQTLIISSFTTYANTLKVREKISGIVNDPKLLINFHIIDEIYNTINLYIKAHK
jgi:AcrR family transcriptional regulator